MSPHRAGPPAILREDVGKDLVTLIGYGLGAVVTGIPGLLILLYGGSEARKGWGFLLFTALFGLSAMISRQAVRLRKSFMVGPDGITFREHIDGKAADQHVPWSEIGYFQVIPGSEESAIYWAPASMPRPASFDQPIYDPEFPNRCAIGKWPIPHEELAALLNSAHLRWRKEPA
jgi:hypothetical protein